MIRTRPPRGNNNPDQKLGKKLVQLQTLSALVNRLQLASRMGTQYGGDRNVYEALGYPTVITFQDYLSRYERQDMARAVIDRPVTATWSGTLQLVESGDDRETQLEKEFNRLSDQLLLKRRFAQLDRLTGIGEYGVLLLGLDDVRTKEGYAQPVQRGNRKLLYVKPCSEGTAEIIRYDNQSRSERYGQPAMYKISTSDTATGGLSDVTVHHSRIVHVVDNMLESDVRGTPRLKSVWNRLMDLEKLVGGSAEMFWRGARPGYHVKLKDDYTLTAEVEEDLQDQIDEYEHKLRRMLVGEGLENVVALAQQVSDPHNHVDVVIQMISAVKGIPKRILTGSERGELASTQDKENWLNYIKSRREEYAEVCIVRPFVDRCITVGVLPKPVTGRYDVEWEDLFAQSEKDRAEIGKTRAEALSKYAAAPMAEDIVPAAAFMEHFLGLSDEEIELIIEQREQQQREEEVISKEEEVARKAEELETEFNE